jgi:hypothetical protein
MPLCLNCHADISARQYGWMKMADKLTDGEFSLATRMAMIGSFELVALAWSQACIRTDSTLLRVLCTGSTGLFIAAALLHEALP